MAPGDVLYRIEVRELPPADLAVITGRVRPADVSGWVAAALDELLGCAGDSGSGPPFAVLPGPDEGHMINVKAALPVGERMEPTGRVHLSHEPAFRALVALHRGPHHALPLVHRALRNAIRDQGVEPAGDPREVYLTDPAELPDPSHNLTEVVWPIAVPREWRPHQRLFTRPLSVS